MELRIGVVHTPKELNLELDGTADEIVGTIDKAHGRRHADGLAHRLEGPPRRRPLDKIAYVEIDEDGANKHVGFGR